MNKRLVLLSSFLLVSLAAYAKLQFSDTQMSQALEKALLCYCELDTLAMVFIWEYFYDMCRKKNNM